MKNILVTGGNGQLGQSLRKISREYPGYRFVFTDIPGMDITNRVDIEEKVKANGITHIINCAAYTNVELAETETEASRQANTEGPKTLAEVAKEHNIKLIHVSTDYVFDGKERSEPYKETDAAAPVNVYGRTKLEGEKAIRSTGCDAAIVRTAWLYSEFGNNFVKTMLRLSREREILEIVDDQYGCPTYATDLARAITALAAKDIKGCEIYHYTDAGITNWYGFATEIFRQAGININVEPVPHTVYKTIAKRPSYSVLDTSKIRALGIATPKWQDSLAKCLKVLGEIKSEKWKNLY